MLLTAAAFCRFHETIVPRRNESVCDKSYQSGADVKSITYLAAILTTRKGNLYHIHLIICHFNINQDANRLDWFWVPYGGVLRNHAILVLSSGKTYPPGGETIVTRQIDLKVNGTPITLDYFVAGYLDHVTGGIIASLKNTGEIKKLRLTIDAKGLVKITLNNADVPINYFVEEIVRSTVKGIIAPLKGVDKDQPLTGLELNIAR
jgi:hypothetical protein